MNNLITKSILAFTFLLICTFSTVSAQVLPTTSGVNLFCKDSDLTLPAAPAGEDWIVKYSATQTTTPSTGVALVSGNKIAAADLNTGYYYLSSKSTTPGSCESELQEIPVYVLQPLVVDITPADFCLESPLAQKGLVTNPEATNITDLAYQWYTVDATNAETAISGENQVNYTPTLPITAGPKKYRLKVGYVINGNKYCPQIATKDVTVTAKPLKPTITPGTITGTATAVTF
jgi:hypothetical protein